MNYVVQISARRDELGLLSRKSAEIKTSQYFFYNFLNGLG